MIKYGLEISSRNADAHIKALGTITFTNRVDAEKVRKDYAKQNVQSRIVEIKDYKE